MCRVDFCGESVEGIVDEQMNRSQHKLLNPFALCAG